MRTFVGMDEGWNVSANIFREQWRYFSEVRLWPSWSRSGSRLKLSRSSAGDSSSSWSCGSWQQLRRSNDSCGEEPRVRQPGKERCRQPSLARSQAMGVPPVFQMGLSTFSTMVAGVCAKCLKQAKAVDITDKNLVQNHLCLPSDSRPPLPPAYLFLVARKFTLTGYERQRLCLSLSWLPPQSACLWLVERQPQLGLWLGGAASARRRPKLGSSREAGKRKSVQGNLISEGSILGANVDILV